MFLYCKLHLNKKSLFNFVRRIQTLHVSFGLKYTYMHTVKSFEIKILNSFSINKKDLINLIIIIIKSYLTAIRSNKCSSNVSMSSNQIHLLGSYSSEHEAIEMMDDDESSNDSDNEELRSEASETASKPQLHFKNVISSINGDENHVLNEETVEKRVEYAPESLEEEEDDERKRFQIELEFVQSLANPNYLNFLAQRGYFRNQTFLNYLKYLMYWKEPEYVKYIMYPQCLSLLEMLQHEQFLKEIVNAQCSKYIDEQLLLIWLHYKKKRDWIRIDATKLPDGIEKLLSSKADSQLVKTVDAELEDAFAASQFLLNEKF